MESNQDESQPSTGPASIPPLHPPPDQRIADPNDGPAADVGKCRHSFRQPELLSDVLCELGCGAEYVEAS